MNGIKQAAKKVSELYGRLLQKRYLEVQAKDRKAWKNVWY